MRARFDRSAGRALFLDSRGLSAVEYALILVLIALAALTAWKAFGGEVDTRAEHSSECIRAMDGACVPSTGATEGSSSILPEDQLSGVRLLGPDGKPQPAASGSTDSAQRMHPPLNNASYRADPMSDTNANVMAGTGTSKTGLSFDVDRAVRRDPELRARIDALHDANVSIAYGHGPGSGSFYSPSKKLIQIDPGLSLDQQIASLVHESTHALDREADFASPEEMMARFHNDRAQARDAFIQQRIDYGIHAEGHAILAELRYGKGRGSKGARVHEATVARYRALRADYGGPTIEQILARLDSGRMSEEQAEAAIGRVIYGNSSAIASANGRTYREGAERLYGDHFDRVIEKVVPLLPFDRTSPAVADPSPATTHQMGDAYQARHADDEHYATTPPPQGPVRAPAEFERTDAVLIDSGADPQFFADIVGAVSPAAPVYIRVGSPADAVRIRREMAERGVDGNRLHFLEYENDAAWTRDYGAIPIFRADGTPAFVDTGYYADRRRDDAIPTLVGEQLDVEVYRPPFRSEGGNFMTNGAGTCVVSDHLFDDAENAERHSDAEIEQIKDAHRRYLGCQQLVVVEPIPGEGTGHLDMFSKFISPNTVLVGEYPEEHPGYDTLEQNAERLSRVRLADGSRLRVVRIPMPPQEGAPYRSYTNSLIVNKTVIVPVYEEDDEEEEDALDVYREHMPGYRVISVKADRMIRLQGAVHCLTSGMVLRPAARGTE